MKILFVMLHAGYVRNYDGVLRRLAADGHQIHIAVENARNKMGENALADRLVADFHNVTWGAASALGDDTLSGGARLLRLFVDYLRYLEPRYAAATALRARALLAVPNQFARLMAFFCRCGPFAARVACRVCVTLDRCIPPSSHVSAYLQDMSPDVVLVTPLVDFGCNQVDYLKAAALKRIPSAVCVASWDNLTSKGGMRFVPDRVFVWNAAQRREAIELHDVPAERVVVTGAQIFDEWFDWRPHRTREEWCAHIGLDPGRPYILYLGSSFFIASKEADFALRWIAALRDGNDTDVAAAGIVIRPHPSNAQQWQGHDLSAQNNLAIWPAPGTDMFAPAFKYDFFDSMYHAAVVVGVNTSALIEAAIVGRPVCTVRAPDFEHSQDGTLHFRHLASAEGGLLHIADSLDEHVRELGRILRGEGSYHERGRRFVETFVRPFGLGEPATPRLASHVLELGSSRSTVARPPTRGVRVIVARIVASILVWWLDHRPIWTYPLRPLFWVFVQLWALRYRSRIIERVDWRGRWRHVRRWLRRSLRKSPRPDIPGWSRDVPKAGKRM